MPKAYRLSSYFEWDDIAEFRSYIITMKQCRPNCGACCIAPSISSGIPGMPNGKPANTPCIQLDDNMRCKIFNDPARPDICHQLQPSEEMCLDSREQALRHLGWLELKTR